MLTYVSAKYLNIPTEEELSSDDDHKYPCNFLHDALKHVHPNVSSIMTTSSEGAALDDTMTFVCYNWIAAEYIHCMEVKFLSRAMNAFVLFEDKLRLKKLMSCCMNEL